MNVQLAISAVAAVMPVASIRQKLIAIGSEPSGEQPVELTARVRAEIAKCKRVAKVAGIQSQ